MKISGDGSPKARANVRIAPVHSKWETLRRPSVIHRLRAFGTKSKREKESLKCNESELLAGATLVQLQECFTCTVCLEVMSSPYSMRQCGHSFCASCILTWCFTTSSLLSGFDSVTCPICRSVLIAASNKSVDPPFTLNKTADDTIRTMIDTISKETDSGNASTLAEWRESGYARVEWRRKERVANKEMPFLAEVWQNMNSDDYIAIKTRLGLREKNEIF